MKRKLFEKFTMGRVLILLYSLVCIVVGYNMYPIVKLSNESIKRYDDIFTSSTRKLQLMNQLRKNFNTIQSAQFRHVLAYSDAMMKMEEEKLYKALAENDAIFKIYEELVDDRQERALLDTVLTMRKNNAATRAELIKLSSSRDRQQAFDYYISRQENSRLVYSNSLEDLMDNLVANTHKKIEETEKYIKKERDYINGALGLSVILIVLTGIVVLTTNRKLNQQNAQLLKQEKKFHTIVETTDEMIFNLNETGKITWANRAMYENLNYPGEELTNRSLDEILGGLSKSKFTKQLSNGNAKMNISETMLSRNGDEVNIEGKSIPLEEAGKISGTQIFVRNVTAKRKAEEKLKTTTTQLENVLNIFDNSFWGSDVVNNKMLYVSPGNEKVFGYTEKEFMADGSLWFKVVADEYKAKFNEAWTALQKGESASLEFKIMHPAKGLRWVETKIAPTLDQGKLIRVDGITIDISERKEKEVELLKNNIELKKINSELDRFVYSTSHDLRAPLLTLEGLINLSEEHIQSRQEVEQFLTIMRRTITEMDDTIKDILEYSRNARMDLVPEELQIGRMIQNTISHFSHRPGVEKIKCSFVIDSPVPFFSDRLRVSAVINNLISNAYKFSRPEEEFPFVKISFVSDQKEGTLTVEDNGEGIPEEIHDKIFEMFVRASEKSEGSGLGLYICKEIVERLNGEINVSSMPGQGSTFTVRIPNMQNISS